MAVTTGAERKILKILSHAPAAASRSFGSRTLVLQPLMIYIIRRWWGEDVFMRPAAMKAPVCRPTLNNCIVPGLLINTKGGWGTIPPVLSGANRGRQEALKLSRGPVSGSPCRLAVIHAAGLIVSDVGYVFCLPTRVCVCVFLHACVLVLTAGMEGIVFLCLPHDWKSLFHCT